MAKLIPIIAVPRSIMEQFLKSTQGMVQRRTWVKDSSGRKGHYRMQWVSPFDAGRGTKDHSKQFDLFGEPEPFEKQEKAPMPEWEEYLDSINKKPGEAPTEADVSRYGTQAFNLCRDMWDDGPWSDKEVVSALADGLGKIGFQGDPAKMARKVFDRILSPANAMSEEVAKKSVKDVEKMILGAGPAGQPPAEKPAPKAEEKPIADEAVSWDDPEVAALARKTVRALHASEKESRENGSNTPEAKRLYAEWEKLDKQGIQLIKKKTDAARKKMEPDKPAENMKSPMETGLKGRYALVSRAGYGSGWEYAKEQTNDRVVMGSARHGAIATVTGEGDGYDVRFSGEKAPKNFKAKNLEEMEKKLRSAFDEATAKEKPTKKEKPKAGDYKVYHDSFTGVVDEVIGHLGKQGLYMAENDVWNKISVGPGKPKDGRTDRYSMPLYDSDGKPEGKAAHFQVYDMGNGKYELNLYTSPLRKTEYEEDKVKVRKEAGVTGAKILKKEPEKPAASYAVDYPNRKLGMQRARTRWKDESSPEAMAEIALANMKQGERFRVGRDYFTVTAISDKTLTYTDEKGEKKSVRPNSEKWGQFIRDVGGAMLGWHHGSDAGDLVTAFRRDPAARYENGVLSIRDVGGAMKKSLLDTFREGLSKALGGR